MLLRYIPLAITLACDLISIVLIVVTFIYNYWLVINSDSTNFGVWNYCKNSSQTCTGWYDTSSDGIIEKYFQSSYKVFQSFQTIFLGLLIIGFLFVLFTVVHCRRSIALFTITGCIHILSGIFALISLLVFGTRVYDYEQHHLNWCYWLSVVALFCTLNSGIFTFAYVFDLRLREKRNAKSPQKDEDSSSSTEKLRKSFYKGKESVHTISSDNINENWTRTKSFTNSSNIDKEDRSTKKSSDTRGGSSETNERLSSTPRVVQHSSQSPPSSKQSRSRSGNLTGQSSHTNSNFRERRGVQKTKRRITHQKRGLSYYKGRSKQGSNSRRANAYLANGVPRLELADSPSEITSISSISKKNTQERLKKFTFYNGTDSYSSGLGVDAEFIQETLKKAKYVNTRPLLKYDRV